MSVPGTFETCRLHRAMSEFEGKAENLAQLAQFGVRFCDFTRIGVSRIKGLCRVHLRFGRVVPTLGIDVYERA
jgi:hypothetical protein